MSEKKKKAAVHYLNARASHMNESLVVKMMAVAEAAGLEDTIDAGDTVAIKLHMGEWNNTAYIRPPQSETVSAPLPWVLQSSLLMVG